MSRSVGSSIRIARTITFSSAHRYYDEKLSESKNRDLYGSLYREKGFGHNFLLEAHFEGEVDELTGMIVNLRDVDAWLKVVADQLDHRNLNQIGVFDGRAPTPERIAGFCFDRIEELVAKSGTKARLFKVRLYEGETLWVDCFAGRKNHARPG